MDGLRGLAALGVVILHLNAFFGARAAEAVTRHNYLAVDFFMLLSGFVIAHAYEEKLKNPASRAAFIRDRFIRLYPLLILGAIFGAATLTLPTNGISTSPGYLLLYASAGIIPFPIISPAWSAFPANFPTWSLFWEVLLNIAFAFAALHITTRRLQVTISICALALIAITIGHGKIDIGAKFVGTIASAPRMLGEFALGILLLRVHRAGVLAGQKRRWWLGPALLISMFALPKVHPASAVFDLAMIFVGFPTLVLAAAGSRPLIASVAKLSGEVSYPLYIMHVPLSRMISYVVSRAGFVPSISIGIVTILIVVILSYVTFLLYDKPVRTILRRRYGGKGHKEAPNSH